MAKPDWEAIESAWLAISTALNVGFSLSQQHS